MKFPTLDRIDGGRQIVVLLGMCAAQAALGAAVTWQQAGAPLFQLSTQAGIAEQGYDTPLMSGASVQVQSGFLANPLLKNNAPFVSSPLPDLAKDAGFATFSIVLDGVFADIDGDSLAYSVATSGSDLTASVHRDSLVLAGAAQNTGTQRVVVSATDGSDTVSDTFQVVVQPSLSLAARPVRISKSTDLSISIPRAIAPLATGHGRGRLEADLPADGENILSMDIAIPSAATVSVSIFDNLGTPIISFERDVTPSDLRNRSRTPDVRWILPVSWNLRAQDGTAVPAGVYLWKVVVRTDDGQKLETVRRLGVRKSP